MPIFQKSVITQYLKSLDKLKVDLAFAKFRENFNSSKIDLIKSMKEEEYQDGFLRDFFVDVLGYSLKPSDSFVCQWDSNTRKFHQYNRMFLNEIEKYLKENKLDDKFKIRL